MYLSLIAKWRPSLSILKGRGLYVIYRDCFLGKWDVIVATYPLCSRWDLEWSFTVEIKGPEIDGILFKIHFLPHIVYSIFSNVTCKLNVLDLQGFLLIPKKEMNLANMKCLNKNNIFFLKYYFLMSFLMKFLLFCSYLTLALKAPTNATCLYSSNTCLLTAKPREEQMSLISLLSFSSSTQTPHFNLSTFF